MRNKVFAVVVLAVVLAVVLHKKLGPRPPALSTSRTPNPERVVQEPARVATDEQRKATVAGESDRAVTAPVIWNEQPDTAPSWTVPYGKEFWRRAERASASRTVANPPGAPANVDIGDVMERVSSAIRREDALEGTPRIKTLTYTALFDRDRLNFSAHRPAGEKDFAPEDPSQPDPAPPAGRGSQSRLPIFEPDETASIWFRTKSIRAGDEELYEGSKAAPRSLLGNTAQALLNPTVGLIEHYETLNEGVELSWVVSQKPVGPLRIELECGGLTFLERSEKGLHFADGTGTSRVRMGNVMLVDSANRRQQLEVEISGTQLVIEVPDALLAAVTYPIAIDPIISPEFGIGVVMANGNQTQPAIAGNGSTWLVAWKDSRTSQWEIYGTRIQSDGTLLDPQGILIAPYSLVGSIPIQEVNEPPAVASNGTDFLVAWSRSNWDVMARRVSAGGVILDANRIFLGTGSYYERFPAAAGLNGNYLVVWQRGTYGSTSPVIDGQRVAGNGTVLDATPIQIGSIAGTGGGNGAKKPGVAASGQEFFVAWENNTAIYGRRVWQSGYMPDPERIYNFASGGADVVSVASDGTGWFITWSHQAGGGVTAARISALGGWLYGFDLSASGRMPVVASIGTDYFAAWREANGNISGTRIQNNNMVDFPPKAIATLQNSTDRIAIARMGSTYLVAWGTASFGTSGDVYAVRTDALGNRLDAAIPVSTFNAGAYHQDTPGIATAISDYLVVWKDYRNTASGPDIYGTRLSQAGSIRDPQGIVICTAVGTQDYPSVAGHNVQGDPDCGGGNGGWFVIWGDYRSNNWDIYGARICASGTVRDPNGFGVCTDAGGQYGPALSPPSSPELNYLVVWYDARYGSYDVFGKRVTYYGVLGDVLIPISTQAGSQYYPSVGTDGGTYLVTWRDDRNEVQGDIYGARVTASIGSVLDPGGFAVCAGSASQQIPATVGGGGQFFVVWDDSRNGGISGFDLYGARVSTGGAVLDPNGIAISTAYNYQGNACLAFNGSTYMVAWQDGRNPTPGYWDIYGATVTFNGVVNDPNGLVISTAPNGQYYPVAAASGSSFLVVYTSYGSGTYGRIRGNFVTP